MKERTLKDLLRKDYSSEVIYKDKKFIGIIKYFDERALRREVLKQIKSGKMVEGAKYWAIKFFNIKETDL